MAYGHSMSRERSDEARYRFGMAIKLANYAYVRRALEEGWPPNGFGGPNMSPLVLTAEHQRPAIAALLIDWGAEVDAIGEIGVTALTHSIAEVMLSFSDGGSVMRWKHVSVLLDAGASLSLVTPLLGSAHDVANRGVEKSAESFTRLLEARTRSVAANAEVLADALDAALADEPQARHLIEQIFHEIVPNLHATFESQFLHDALDGARSLRNVASGPMHRFSVPWQLSSFRQSLASLVEA